MVWSGNRSGKSRWFGKSASRHLLEVSTRLRREETWKRWSVSTSRIKRKWVSRGKKKEQLVCFRGQEMERKTDEKRWGDQMGKKVSVNESKRKAFPSSFKLLGCADHLKGQDFNASLAAERLFITPLWPQEVDRGAWAGRPVDWIHFWQISLALMWCDVIILWFLKEKQHQWRQ